MVQKAKHRIPAQNRTRNKLFAIGSMTVAMSVAALGLTSLASNAAPAVYVIDKPVASDTFNRVVSNGWGSAPVGGAYAVSRAASFSDSGTVGTALPVKSGASVTASLPNVSASDVLASDVLQVPKVPATGNGVYSGVQVRSAGGSYYKAQLRIGSSGNANISLLRVNSSTTTQTVLAPEKVAVRGVKAGEKLDIDIQVTGSSPVLLSARAYAVGSTTPDWQVTASDASGSRILQSGAVELWSYISSATTAQAVDYSQLHAWSLKLDSGATSTGTPIPTTQPTPTPSPTVTPTPTPTPTPSSTPTPPPTTGAPTSTTGSADDPAIDTTGMRKPTGSAPLGSTSYPIPASALFVAPAGSDSGGGTISSPFATVAHAIAVAHAGQTIVLRAGNYHESVTIPAGKPLTIQSYPGEVVWFDGSVPVTNWQQSGSVWAATGWNHVFDSSPTFTRGAPDGTTEGWQWVNSSYPMAAHPDQLFVNGVSQQQVATVGQVKPGTFYYDTSAHTLYMGTNPSGASIRASDLIKAITNQSVGSTFRGFGVHRYADSVPDFGAVVSGAGSTTVENMIINDNATTGLSLGGSNDVVHNVTAARNGLLGIHTDESDNIRVDGLLAAQDDHEHFNSSPVSGGLKVTRSRNVTVINSAFIDNYGQGLWMDESIYNMTFVNDDAIGNAANGIVMEISSTATLANDFATGNGNDGIKIDEVSNVNVWNNTLTNNGRNLDITQDTRRAANPNDYGHDPRQAFPDPTMTWIDGPINVHNNVISSPTGNCLICVEDYSHQYSASQLGVSLDANVYQRTSASAPTWAAIWSRGSGNPAVYNSLAQFTAATGQDAHSVELDGTPAVFNTLSLTPQLAASQGTLAMPLPANIAALTGQTAGVRHIGVW